MVSKPETGIDEAALLNALFMWLLRKEVRPAALLCCSIVRVAVNRKLQRKVGANGQKMMSRRDGGEGEDAKMRTHRNCCWVLVSSQTHAVTVDKTSIRKKGTRGYSSHIDDYID